MKLVCGQTVEFKLYDRKLKIKDFEQFGYETTFEEMTKQLGEPNGMWGSGMLYPYYELSDGKFVICNFWLYSELIWIKLGTKKAFERNILPPKLDTKSVEQKEFELINAQKSEINAILQILGIKNWNRHYFSSLDWDEPLGAYSKQKLNSYTNRNIKIDISYYFGSYKEEPFQPLFQIFEIYEDNKHIYFGVEIWEKDWVLAEEWYSIKNQKEILNADKSDKDIFKIKLEKQNFTRSVLEFMSGKREIKKGRDQWIEFWGVDEHGNYMCVYYTSLIKREEGIDLDSRFISHYYVTIETENNKVRGVHVKELKWNTLVNKIY